MFFVKIMGGTKRVTFRHQVLQDGGLNIGRATFCSIHSVRPGGKIHPSLDLVAHGEASCHPNDNYNKNIGRKLSLSRALQMLYPNKGERSFSTRQNRYVFWQVYFGKRGKY